MKSLPASCVDDCFDELTVIDWLDRSGCLYRSGMARVQVRLGETMFCEGTCGGLTSCFMHAITLICITDNKRWISSTALWPL